MTSAAEIPLSWAATNAARNVHGGDVGKAGQTPSSRSVVVVTSNVAAAAGEAAARSATIVVARSPFQRIRSLSPRSRGVGLALAQDDRLLLDLVTNGHDA